MNPKRITSAADRLLEVERALLEAGVAPNGRFVRAGQDLNDDLDLFARCVTTRAAA
jgi:hypothetical protein